MIFLTVGTIFPFDRLVKAVDNAVAEGSITEEVFAQVGLEAKKPDHIESVESLDKKTFDKIAADSSCMISHAGMGSILAALNLEKPLLVMPRLRKYRENINDHQIATAEKFEQLGHIMAVYNTDQVPEKLSQIKSFKPKPWHSQVEKVVERINFFLEYVEKTND